jgi:hypothetical protein
VICEVSAASSADVDRAVAAARAAFEGPWKATAGTARGRLMLKLADLVEEEQETLATIEAMDNGKPYSQALGDIEEVFSVLRYYGGWADKTYGQTIETGRQKFTYTRREPIGVCGQIIPYVHSITLSATVTDQNLKQVELPPRYGCMEAWALLGLWQYFGTETRGADAFISALLRQLGGQGRLSSWGD